MYDTRPIGVFDSGVGGLSVWKEIVKILPNESVIYYADSANCPYGSKKKHEIIALAKKNVDFLLEKQCKIIVVACNTATAAAIDYLRDNYEVPFIGMEPAVKPASLKSKTKSIGVLATEGTFNGRLYQETTKRFARDVQVNIQVGEKLVDIVEKGLIYEENTKAYLQELMNPLIEKNIDHLVLGCTHYPFLIPVLRELLPQQVEILDPAFAVARQTKNILMQKRLIHQDAEKIQYEFYTTGDADILKSFLNKLTDKNYYLQQV
ncbi:MAG: glutamate racemase [Bacteroidales bacterium]|jgi:glutamate racemase|nr:glutamate racemase [Bacteroidales bacterium]